MDNEDLRKKFRAWRRSQRPKVTQGQIAESLGVAQATICGFETGRRDLSHDLADKLEKMMRPESNAARLLAEQLRTLADIVESPDYPLEYRARKFVTAIQEWAADAECVVGPLLRYGQDREKDEPAENKDEI